MWRTTLRGWSCHVAARLNTVILSQKTCMWKRQLCSGRIPGVQRKARQREKGVERASLSPFLISFPISSSFPVVSGSPFCLDSARALLLHSIIFLFPWASLCSLEPKKKKRQKKALRRRIALVVFLIKRERESERLLEPEDPNPYQLLFVRMSPLGLWDKLTRFLHGLQEHS